MYPVCAADLDGVFELKCPPLQDRFQALQPSQQNAAGLPDLQCLRGIHYIVGREPIMQPPGRIRMPGRLQALGHCRGECDHVVLHFFLDPQYVGSVEAGVRS